MNLTYNQASVAFDRYQIRKNYQAKVKLSPTARGLIGKINRANGNLGRVGAWEHLASYIMLLGRLILLAVLLIKIC